MDQMLIFFIKIYQAIFLPHRTIPRCKYFPSCSDYAIASVEKYGAVIGITKSAWRIIRCNPLTKGGVDLP